MTVIKVPDMHCEMCVKRITKAMSEANLNFTVSLENKTVSIDGDEMALKQALLELDDLGFSPEI
jgi:copper chaperone